MFEAGPLASWIQPQHLTEEAVTSYRTTLEQHPARMILIRDFLVPPEAERLGGFLAEDAEYRSEFGLYSEEEGVSEARWLDAPEDDRFFRFGKLLGPKPGHEMRPGMLAYMRFRAALQSEPFKSYFEEIVHLPLTTAPSDIGVHAFGVGDFLREHDDDNRDRRLALVLYLSPGWTSGFGGTLRMVAPGGQVEEFAAEYNSIAVFDVKANDSHSVLPVQPAAGEQKRFTIGGWYHDPETVAG